MKRTFQFIFIAALFIVIFCGCGGLHYSQVDPEAGNFHPKRIAVLPVDVGPYGEAGGIVDGMIAEVLIQKRWFNNVVAGNDFKNLLQSNDDLRKVVTDYTEKLKTVNFSDPQLSARIGDLCQSDAFLVMNVEYWNYTTDNEDKVGKVGMGIKLVDAATGRVVWTAGHYRSEKYLLVKPDLLNVAKALFKEMIGYMPR